MEKESRFYQASTSEMFGGLDYNRPGSGYNEDSLFHPRSPYGVAKLYAHWIARNYRESYGMFVSTGILFNHEGERRGLEFVTRKITNAVAKIHLGIEDHVTLGDLWPKRDWGYAGDYVRGMWQMLQHDEPDDFVLATGETHSIEEFLTLASPRSGSTTGDPHVRQDPQFMRPGRGRHPARRPVEGGEGARVGAARWTSTVCEAMVRARHPAALRRRSMMQMSASSDESQ